MSSIAAPLIRVPGALAVLLSTLLVALAITSSGHETAAAAAISAIVTAAISSAVAARYVAAAIRTRSIRVGHRAPRHAESLDRIAEPSHPGTTGRARPRAPGRVASAA